MSVRSHGNPERSRKTEVSKLEVVIFIDQQILRLEVAMEDAVGVTVECAAEELVGELLDLQANSGLARWHVVSTVC